MSSDHCTIYAILRKGDRQASVKKRKEVVKDFRAVSQALDLTRYFERTMYCESVS